MTIQDRVYGEQEITDPLALELLQTPAIQRLKGIHQYGVFHLYNPKLDTTRWDHSVGVYLLLKKYDAPREECIAGLLHDVGHMAFSHVIDFLYDRHVEQDTGDNETVAYVKNRTKIPEVLAKFDMTVEAAFDESRYPLLERDLPDLCADRIDYTLRDGVTYGIMNAETVEEYLGHLHAENQKWVFDDFEAAHAYAEDVMMLCESFWTSPAQVFIYLIAVEALKASIDQGILTEADFWLTDAEVMKKMEAGDARVQALIQQMREFDQRKVNAAEGEGEIVVDGRKLRLQDPLVKRGQSLIRVREEAKDFAKKWDELDQAFKTPLRFPRSLMA